METAHVEWGLRHWRRFLNFLRGMETCLLRGGRVRREGFLNFLRGMETLPEACARSGIYRLPKLP